MAMLPERPVVFIKGDRRKTVCHTAIARELLRSGWTQEGTAPLVKKEEKKPLPEILVEAGTDAYDDDSIKEPQAAEGALEEMTKAELLDWALKQGHDLPNNDLKSEIFARCKEIKAGF